MLRTYAGSAVSIALATLLGNSVSDVVWHHRNLGKAFYENPTTQLMAVDEFKKALDLAPDSARERVNYGLALLRAGKSEEGAGELLKAQKQDPTVRANDQTGAGRSCLTL